MDDYRAGSSYNHLVLALKLCTPKGGRFLDLNTSLRLSRVCNCIRIHRCFGWVQHLEH